MKVPEPVVNGVITVLIIGCGWLLAEIIDLKDKQGVIENEILYMSKTLDACIQRDVYEIDKLYMVERLKNMGCRD